MRGVGWLCLNEGDGDVWLLGHSFVTATSSYFRVTDNSTLDLARNIII